MAPPAERELVGAPVGGPPAPEVQGAQSDSEEALPAAQPTAETPDHERITWRSGGSAA